MRAKRNQRALRRIVWASRAIGWVVIGLAVLNVPQIGALTGIGASFRALSSVALVLVGITIIIGVELFLRFFDRYLSRN